MRDEWAADFEARARAYWTEARTRDVIGDKKPLILPSEAPTLLRALGLLFRDGSMPPKRVRKYRQINHMLLMLRTAMRDLGLTHEVVGVVDAGCGRSYLTLLLGWWFTRIAPHPVRILGIDQNPDVIEESRRRALMVGLDAVIRFQPADLSTLDLEAQWSRAWGDDAPGPHALIALHACDTATDDAIVHGVRAGADFIAVAPCCQAELGRHWEALAATGATTPFSAIHASPHLRRTTAATVTDTYRMLLLRAAGYEVDVIEFVASDHTPKNTLIRATRTGRPDEAAAEELRRLREATGGIGIALEARLADASTP